MNKYRKDFPFFKAIDEHNSKENAQLVYFDTSATAQRPFIVLDAMKHFYATANANPLRGLYDLSERATQAYEHSRETVANFLNAKDSCEIIFTRNASESLNLIAYSYGMSKIQAGDEIVITGMEHHSNMLPWRMVCQAKGAKIVYLDCDKKTGIIPDSEYQTKITNKTKIVAMTQVSNVLGVENPVKKVAKMAHAVGAVMVVDGAQSVPHMKVDVQDLDCDFLAFSGHKLGGPMGIGVLYAKKDLLEEMPPFLQGGEIIEYVTRDSVTYAELPHKFEAGTVSAGDAVGLAAAIRYIQSVGFDFIEEHEQKLSKIMMDGMKKIPHIHFVGSDNPLDRHGIVTFTIDGVHPHDIATLLSDEHIAIRAGHHCAQPLGQYLGVQSSARASLYLYNTEEEVEYFVEKLSHLREWSGYKD